MSTRAMTFEGGKQQSKALPVTLWAAQVLLALAFGVAGWMKVSTPLVELVKSMPDMAAMSGGLVRFIGIAELAGAIGLLLPSLTRIAPDLTPLAAIGLATIMVLATLFHISRGEFSAISVTLTLGALAVFVAWGRTRRAPILARS